MTFCIVKGNFDCFMPAKTVYERNLLIDSDLLPGIDNSLIIGPEFIRKNLRAYIIIGLAVNSAGFLPKLLANASFTAIYRPFRSLAHIIKGTWSKKDL